MSQRELPAWIREHVEMYLATNGKEGHMWDSSAVGGSGLLPTLLITTTGRKSGRSVTIPLVYGKSGESYVVIGSRGGHPKHPSWYLNLVAEPGVRVQVAERKFEARGRTAKGEERARLWKLLRDIYPPYDEYQKFAASREIPVVVLEPLRVGQ